MSKIKILDALIYIGQAKKLVSRECCATIHERNTYENVSSLFIEVKDGFIDILSEKNDFYEKPTAKTSLNTHCINHIIEVFSTNYKLRDLLTKTCPQLTLTSAELESLYDTFNSFDLYKHI